MSQQLNSLTFKQFLARTRGPNFKCPGALLSIDPGHTTGWSLFIDGELRECGQIDTVVDRKGRNEGRIDWEAVGCLMDILINCKCLDMHVVCEDYRVYAHKLDRHTNSQVLTIRIIGAIDFICHSIGCKTTYQLAATAKGFSDDKKLKMFGYYNRAQRHSRDSIRHAIYYLLFNKDINK